jgi:6-phospho-3-hexuloisomerase
MADHLVEVPVPTDEVGDEGRDQALLPGGSLFEQATLLIGDAMVLPLAERRKVPTDRAFALHANLE